MESASFQSSQNALWFLFIGAQTINWAMALLHVADQAANGLNLPLLVPDRGRPGIRAEHVSSAELRRPLGHRHTDDVYRQRLGLGQPRDIAELPFGNIKIPTVRPLGRNVQGHRLPGLLVQGLDPGKAAGDDRNVAIVSIIYSVTLHAQGDGMRGQID